VTAPIDRSTTWPYEDGEPGAFSYARFSSPTVAEAERALGELDGGEALLFASGAAASTAIVLALLEPGQTVALAEGAYYGTGVLFAELARWGLRHVEFDQTGPPPSGVDLVWLEAPSNPFLTMPDFEAAGAHTARVVCDSTAATPLHVRPLDLKCDFALHSATKSLAGHDDALVGAVVSRDPGTVARLREFRSRTGSVAAPDVAWLLLRSLKTLELRVARQTESARSIADQLRAHPAVTIVRYPGFGPLLSFDVADAGAARRVETEHDQPGRRDVADRSTLALGKRARPAGLAPAIRRPRGPRRALGRSRARPRRGRGVSALAPGRGAWVGAFRSS
jgi:cystathionine gamma-synthase